jgi:type IV pilus biogenesis protein CpaD/CtpE
MRFLVLFLMLLSLAACATTPLTINQAAAVPKTRILAPQLLAQASNTGSLVVKRDSGFMGSACTIRVFVDAVPVADLKSAEKVELFVALGEHSVVATSNGICGGGTSEAAVVIMPERQRILRIASGQSGDIFLQPSGF